MLDPNTIRKLYKESQILGVEFDKEDVSRADTAARKLMTALYANALEIAEALEDRERMNYLDSNQDVYFVRQDKTDVRLLTTDHDFMQDPEFVQADSLRAAIDAARREDAR